MSLSRRLAAGSTRSVRAFTLVEMLVVLGIIGILVALLLPAVMAAVRNARNASIALEIKNLDTALNTYKQQRGEYPPSFGDYNTSGNLVYNITMAGVPNRYNSKVEAHLLRCYTKLIDYPANSMDNKDRFYIAAMEVDQAEALVLWLSLTSTDPANPFEMNATRHGYYEFDQRRLITNGDSDGIPIFVSRYTRDQPYMYVENRNYVQFMQANCAPKALTPDGTLQRCCPYGSSATTPMNPNTFQILCAGQDGDWGGLTTPSGNPSRYPAKVFPGDDNANYSAGDRDNLTNFSEGRTLGDARPQ